MATNPNPNPLADLFGVFAGVGAVDILDSLFGKAQEDQLDKLLVAARQAWDEDRKQSNLTNKENEYLRGQAELIVFYLTAEGALTFSPLHPDTSALVEVVRDRILPR